MGTIRNRSNTLQALDGYWRDIINGTDRAERNMAELQPGFSSQTPGNGSPGGGSGGHGMSITERLALEDKTDPADVANREYARIVNVLKVEMPKLHALVAQWDYPTAGEHTAGALPRIIGESAVNKHADPGCVSCHRPEVLRWEPVHKASLCRWCYDFRRAENMLPPTPLLLLHLRGDKMTTALVSKHIKAAKEAEAAKAPKKKTVNPSRKKKAA